MFLGELLEYLDRGDADELVLQSGQTVRLRGKNGEREHGNKALTRDSILSALHGASVGAAIPKEDTAGEVEVVEIRGRAYMMNIAKFLDLIEVRIARMPGDEGPAPAPDTSGRTRQELTRQTKQEVARQTKQEVERQTRQEVERQTKREVGRQTQRDISGPIRLDGGTTPEIGPPTELPPIPTPWGDSPTGDAEPSAPRAAGVPRHIPAAASGPTPLSVIPPAPKPRAARATGSIVANEGGELPRPIAEALAQARREGASDVHVQAGEPIRIRKAGRLESHSHTTPPELVTECASALLDARLVEQFDAHGYVDFAAERPGAGRLRMNLCRQRGGLKLCARLVADRPPSAADLGFPPEMERFKLLHQGLCVIAGPSGHGKTTTLAALIDQLNRTKGVHIITVEDPVEIIHPVAKAIVTQREVGRHTHSFATALKAALREDPDVIAIGELRDRETVEMALSAAETGHLVIATMNTPSGAKTIERLIELFPPEDQSQVRATMCGALKLIVSQRLIRRTDGTGRVAAFEVITGGPPLWGLIRDRKLHQLPSLLQRGKAYGMRRIEESLRELVLQKAITHEQALRFAEDPRALAGNDPTAGASWNPSGGR